MNQPESNATARAAESLLANTISAWAREASIELNVQDTKHLYESRKFLSPGRKIYVSFLPKQRWTETESACIAVRAAGFEPVPHLPVRLLPDRATLEHTLDVMVREAQIREVLLIAGDYATSTGPYASVADVLRTGVLEQVGLTRVSLAGHPEGHPRVALDEIRRAEREKIVLAARAGLEPRLLTQFCFEADPVLDWISQLRAAGIQAPVVAGLAGPARLVTLLKFAMRCGAGPSIRARGRVPVHSQHSSAIRDRS